MAIVKVTEKFVKKFKLKVPAGFALKADGPKTKAGQWRVSLNQLRLVGALNQGKGKGSMLVDERWVS